MSEKMGSWVRHTEGHCRKCSRVKGLNREEYCEGCWGKKIIECVEAERRKETEALIREKEEERLAEEAEEQGPPTLEEEVATLKKEMSELKAYLGLSRSRMVH